MKSSHEKIATIYATEKRDEPLHEGKAAHIYEALDELLELLWNRSVLSTPYEYTSVSASVLSGLYTTLVNSYIKFAKHCHENDQNRNVLNFLAVIKELRELFLKITAAAESEAIDIFQEKYPNEKFECLEDVIGCVLSEQ